MALDSCYHHQSQREERERERGTFVGSGSRGVMQWRHRKYFIEKVVMLILMFWVLIHTTDSAAPDIAAATFATIACTTSTTTTACGIGSSLVCPRPDRSQSERERERGKNVRKVRLKRHRPNEWSRIPQHVGCFSGWSHHQTTIINNNNLKLVTDDEMCGIPLTHSFTHQQARWENSRKRKNVDN